MSLGVALRSMSSRVLVLVLVLNLQTAINLQDSFVEAFSTSLSSYIAPVTKWTKWNKHQATSFCQTIFEQQTFGFARASRNVASTSLKSTISNDFASNEDAFTIQILMSDTGGGHRASANALRDALNILYPGKIECDIVDIFTQYGPMWPYNDYVGLYKIMAEYSFLWDTFYQFGATEAGFEMNQCLMELFCFESFTACLERTFPSTGRRADMVISVHPLCQDLPLKILAYLDSERQSRNVDLRTTPFCTVVTDLAGAHPTWFHPGVDKCFVPTDVLYKLALSRQLQRSQLVQYGLPIRKGFWALESDASNSKEKSAAKASRISRVLQSIRRRKTNGDDDDQFESSSATDSVKLDVRTKLGLDENFPVALVVGGGDGMGGIVDIAKALGTKLGSASQDTAKFQLVVVCGKNEQARSALQGFAWGKGVKVLVTGFVNNMDEWMKASDALVTKAGPGTIAEACICGLPCMLFAYLPGQEEGNVPFVEDSGFGKYSSDPTVIAETVSSWLSSPETMSSMQQAALDAARPSATLDIARDLAAMVFATRPVSALTVAAN